MSGERCACDGRDCGGFCRDGHKAPEKCPAFYEARVEEIVKRRIRRDLEATDAISESR